MNKSCIFFFSLFWRQDRTLEFMPSRTSIKKHSVSQGTTITRKRTFLNSLCVQINIFVSSIINTRVVLSSKVLNLNVGKCIIVKKQTSRSKKWHALVSPYIKKKKKTSDNKCMHVFLIFTNVGLTKLTLFVHMLKH